MKPFSQSMIRSNFFEMHNKTIEDEMKKKISPSREQTQKSIRVKSRTSDGEIN